MKPRTPREIPVLFIRGSEELGRATGFTDKRIHAQWREQGLKYCVSKDGTFLYEPKEVVKFLNSIYAPKEVKESLKA
jgi:hypothetical protein